LTECPDHVVDWAMHLDMIADVIVATEHKELRENLKFQQVRTSGVQFCLTSLFQISFWIVLLQRSCGWLA
jgi:hypothetical protein